MPGRTSGEWFKRCRVTRHRIICDLDFAPHGVIRLWQGFDPIRDVRDVSTELAGAVEVKPKRQHSSAGIADQIIASGSGSSRAPDALAAALRRAGVADIDGK